MRAFLLSVDSTLRDILGIKLGFNACCIIFSLNRSSKEFAGRALLEKRLGGFATKGSAKTRTESMVTEADRP